MPKFPVPESNVEWPEWEYRAFPAFVGRDENGADLIAQNAEEAREMAKDVVYPKKLGVDKKGNDVIALDPTEERLKQSDVVPDGRSNKLTKDKPAEQDPPTDPKDLKDPAPVKPAKK